MSSTLPLPHSDLPPPTDGTFLGPLDPDRRLTILVLLDPGDTLDELAANHATASHAAAESPEDFRHDFLQPHELEARCGASREDLARVVMFLLDGGLAVEAAHAPARLVRASGRAADLAALFAVELHAYSFGGEPRAVQVGAIHLPSDIVPLVHSIHGLDERPVAHRDVQASTPGLQTRPHPPAADEGPPYRVTTLAQLYDLPAEETGAGRTVTLLEFGGGYSHDLLDTYFQTILGRPGPRVRETTVLGAENQSRGMARIEVLLDIQICGTVVPDAEIHVVLAPNTFAAWIAALHAALFDPAGAPDVISISWGILEHQFPPKALEAIEDLLISAASMGVTVLASSGDHGVDPDDGKVSVNYPASSAYTLACGGTEITTNAKKQGGLEITREVAWSQPKEDLGTGGGISQRIGVPKWQQSTDLPPTLLPDGQPGRGLPDVAASALGWAVYIGPDTWLAGGGTSAVAPFLAGFVAQLANLGGRRFGLLNPHLYADPGRLFRPVTKGNNGVEGTKGYAAGPGWNACTGLGVPVAARWQDALGKKGS